MSIKHIFNRCFFILFLFCFVLLFCSQALNWIDSNFSRVNFDEVASVLTSGLGGVDSKLFWSFFREVILRAFGFSILLSLIGEIKIKYLRCYIGIGVVCFFAYRLTTINIEKGSFSDGNVSNFYETYYVAPENIKITFPVKNNVLVIALESIEKIYNDESVFNESIIPGIAKLERENITFENYHELSGLSHTIAAITGFTTGLPLFYSRQKPVRKMLGVTTGIGTIFKNNGYKTYSIFPASGRFSLKQDFLERMGFDVIYDGVKLKEMFSIDLEYCPFNGIDDGTLFDVSKPIILDIVKSEEPYFLFMETVNTHGNGYPTQTCRDMGFLQNEPKDIIKCEDKLIYDFVMWFLNQDPEAVVILLDDHNQHNKSMGISKIKNRPLSNVFINASALNGTDLKKNVSAMDFFPTIIEAAGGIVDGCKLGLGTSLSKRCEKEKTLREMFAPKDLKNMMEHTDDLYYELFTGTPKNNLDSQGVDD